MASMTYLQIAQLAHRILKGGNAQSGSQPTTIPPTGVQDPIVFDISDMVPRAWEEIQNESPSWNFMRKRGTFTLTAGTRQYTLATLQASFSLNDYYGFIPFFAPNSPDPYFLLYDAGASTQVDYIYPFIEYIDWRGWWDRLPRPANGQPNRMTEHPSKTLEFDPAPALAPSGGNWAIRFDYRQTNQVLSAPPTFRSCRPSSTR